jgi:hypothetical protein
MTKGRPQFSKNFNAIFNLLKLPTFIANKPHMPGSNSSVNTPIQLLRTTLVLLAICRRLPGPLEQHTICNSARAMPQQMDSDANDRD